MRVLIVPINYALSILIQSREKWSCRQLLQRNANLPEWRKFAPFYWPLLQLVLLHANLNFWQIPHVFLHHSLLNLHGNRSTHICVIFLAPISAVEQLPMNLWCNLPKKKWPFSDWPLNTWCKNITIHDSELVLISGQTGLGSYRKLMWLLICAKDYTYQVMLMFPHQSFQILLVLLTQLIFISATI